MTRLAQPVLTLFICFFFILPLHLSAGERRAMTLEDVMNFHHIHNHNLRINADGSWVAYAAWPDRGDGYGVVVSTDGDTEYTVARAENPFFSAGGRWALFIQQPPFADREEGNAGNRSAVVLDTSDGDQLTYDDVQQARFSQSRDLLFVQHTFVEDTLLTDEENEKMKGAGTTLTIRDLDGEVERSLSFVEYWTADSLASTLVFTLKDTLESHNGLYHFDLHDLSSEPQPLDTIGNASFGRFTWFEEASRLAFMREDILEEDTMETARLFIWEAGDTEPQALLGQEDAREGYFLPADSRLQWTRDGSRLYFGLRPERFAAQPDEDTTYESALDSIRQHAEVDIWHGDDPLIKTHEKQMWSQIRRQNLLSVYHLDQERITWLADEEVNQLQVAETGDHALLTTTIPYSRRITWEGRFRDVYVVNLHDGERQMVLEEMQGFTSLSPDGKYLLYFLDKDWHVYDVATGTHRNLTGDIETPFYSETHDRPSTVPGYGMDGWLEDGHTALIYDRYDLWRVNLQDGELQNITEGWGRDNNTTLRVRKLDDEPHIGIRETLYLEGFNNQNKQRSLFTARVHREGVDQLYDTSQNVRLRALSADGSTFLFTNESQDVFPDLWASNTRFREPQQLSNLQEQLREFNWGKAKLVDYRSADGIPLQGIVITPGDYDPDKQYPVFVYYYEKYSQRLHEFNQTVINHRPGFGYYASNGYVVFLPDIHFLEGRPGMSAVKSLVPAVQTIIDMGIADPDAIGLHGHSWSGYQTAYVVTQTDLFAAAIAGAPVSNMTSAYGGIRWGSGLARQFQYETGQSRLGSSIFDRRYLYIENSPVFYAHEINTPMLIMHGDVDDAVPWEQSIEMYLAMRRADKDVIFLQYRNEPHHLRKYPNRLDYTIRMKEYFDHYLRGKEAPEWIRYGVPYMGE